MAAARLLPSPNGAPEISQLIAPEGLALNICQQTLGDVTSRDI